MGLSDRGLEIHDLRFDRDAADFYTEFGRFSPFYDK